jgi:NADP-dependent 3-hydroxy acid dehydrogenase YdfG
MQGRVAVVTGATGAIGHAIVNRLINRGAVVYAVGSTRQGVDDLIGGAGWPVDQVRGYSVDLNDDAVVERFGTDCLASDGPIDVLVHSAGVIDLQPFARAPLAELDRQYRINVRAPFRLTQALLPKLVASKGQVVFVNSTAGLRASRDGSQYGATKHALRALADSLRDEVNSDGIRVLSVFLGRTASRMQSAVHRYEGRPYNESKLLQPDDVAAVVMNALELPRTAEVTDVWIRPLVKSY